jgi:DNA transformation protein
MKKLIDLPNIGVALESQLNKVGIFTYEDLKAAGSKDAWFRIFVTDSSACINRLMALEGAIQGIKKTLLSEEVKADSKAFYNEIKQK